MPALAMVGTAIRGLWPLLLRLMTWRAAGVGAAVFIGWPIVIHLRKLTDDVGSIIDAGRGSLPFTIEPDPDDPGGTILVPKTKGPFGSGIDGTTLLIGGGVALGIVILIASRR